MLFAAFGAKAHDLRGTSTEVLGIVELFTSQGCNACPPADLAIRELIEEGHVIALSYHVDYWDYLGWEDTLAESGNTQRQYEYAEAMERSGVYTPQAVLNGREHVNGSDKALILQRLRQLKADNKGLSVDVKSAINSNDISIDIAADADVHSIAGHAEVVVIYFNEKSTVEVQRGENAGKTIDYWHNVTDVQVIGKWDGDGKRFTLPLSQLPLAGDTGFVALVQTIDLEGNPKEIIGASLLMSRPAG